MGRRAGRAESSFAPRGAVRPGCAVSDTPQPCYGGPIFLVGLGVEHQTGLCATQREGGFILSIRRLVLV